MSGVLYFDCASGISGDMTIGALLDLGADREKLIHAIDSLGIDGYELKFDRVIKNSVSAFKFDVMLTEHHDHESHGPEGHHHHHGHRHLGDIVRIIEGGALTPRASELAKKMFGVVAEAEAKAHGVEVEQVHFHEVGAVDSIIDIVGTAVCIDDLDPEYVVISPLSDGQGYVNCAHGTLPVPVPAVANIAAAHGLKLRITDTLGEMVTPTGIAIAAALRTRSSLPGEYLVSKVGIGLGKRDFGRANLLRAMLIEEKSDPEQIYVVECNIDDSTGEAFGYAMEKLLENGAKDVHFLPCFMKKNRPAYLLRAIVTETLLPKIETIIFETTTTIGLRKFPVERTCMQREAVELTLPFGTVRAKKCVWNDVERCYPEYESIKQLSESSGIDFHTVFTQAKRIAEEWNVKV